MEDIKRIKDQIMKSRDIQKILQKYTATQSPHGKVNYAEQILHNFRHLTRLERENTLRDGKDERRAMDFLGKAREIMNTKSESDVVMVGNFNKCLGFAERLSENITLAYAGRARAMLKWKQFDDCLDNVRMALETPYGRRHGSGELAKIETDCRQQMHAPHSSPKPEPSAQLTYAPHSGVPFIAEALDVTPSDPELRVYTKQVLEAGDIISVEEPFCFYINEKMHRYKCVTCAKDLNTVVPCPYCTRTLFCSRKCQDEGNRVFHRFECCMINFLLDNIDDFHLIALRITLVAISLFPTMKDMIEFCRDEANKDQNSFTIDYSGPDRKIQQYRAIMNWAGSREKVAPVDVFQVGLVAAIFKHFLLKHTPMKNILNTEQEKNFLGELLFRHIQTCPHNCEGMLIALDHKNGDRTLEILGLGAYPFLSMVHITHEPNLTRAFEGTNCVLTSLRRTMPGETMIQPFCHHQIWEHTKLHSAYDTKLFDDLEFIDVPEKLNLRDVRGLLSGDRQFAEDHIPSYSHYLYKNARFYPCYQISLVEHCLYMSFGLLADAIPLETYIRNMFPTL